MQQHREALNRRRVALGIRRLTISAKPLVKMHPRQATGKSISFATVLARAEEVLAKPFEDKAVDQAPAHEIKRNKRRVKVREASFEDYPQISHVHARNGLTAKSCL